MKPSVEIDIDLIAEAVYFRLSENAVQESIEAQPDIIVDLDQHGVVVGVEMLRLGAVVPWDAVAQRFHIRSEVRAILDAVEATYVHGISLTQGFDSVTVPDSDLESV